MPLLNVHEPHQTAVRHRRLPGRYGKYDRTSPVLLLVMMVRQFRHIYRAKFLLQEGFGTSDLVKKLGLPMIFVRQVVEQAQLFSVDQLKILYERFLEKDLQLKTSNCNPRLILESLIVEVCRM